MRVVNVAFVVFGVYVAGCASAGGSGGARSTADGWGAGGGTGVAAGVAAGGGGDPAAGSELALALATFDSAWSRIHETYYDADFRGLDWAGVRAELRPRVEAAPDDESVRARIREMLGRLGESHFALIPREAAGAFDSGSGAEDAAVSLSGPGLELRWIDSELVVTRVAVGRAADLAGVRPGWRVERIDGRDVAAFLDPLEALAGPVERRAGKLYALGRVMALLHGAEGTRVRLVLRDGGGGVIARELERERAPGEPVRVGDLPTLLVHLEWERVPLDGGACAGLIRFNLWMPQILEPFNGAVDALSDCRGIVIDLRGNAGGLGGMVMGVSGSFLAEPVALGTMRQRHGELRLVANPRPVGGRPGPYGGRLALLVDGATLSTAEIFAAALQALGRARIFGITTAGQALPSWTARLPNGDVLYHAHADFTDPNGTRIEGTGVVPDEALPLDRAALLAGRDLPLKAALAWIGSDPAQAPSADGAPAADQTPHAPDGSAGPRARSLGPHPRAAGGL